MLKTVYGMCVGKKMNKEIKLRVLILSVYRYVINEMFYILQ